MTASSSRARTTLADIKGQNVNLVELSVSHYLLARGLDTVGLKEADITVVNTSDADMVAAYTTADVTAVVTWNPLLSEIAAFPDANKVFNSSQIPGEIIDIMMVNTETLKDNPDFGKALVGAWYEAMALMAADDRRGERRHARRWPTASGTDLAGFNAQLATTQMFYDPAEAVAFTNDAKLIDTMKFVAQFLFDHGILGEGATSPDFVGMEFPGGKTLGDTDNVKLRFDPSYMAMAAEGSAADRRTGVLEAAPSAAPRMGVVTPSDGADAAPAEVPGQARASSTQPR